MRLHNLISTRSARHRRKLLGRGHGSGHGKTSGKGHKGQKARSGGSIRPMFESGHVPLYRRLPNRGFNNARFKKVYALVNVGDLEKVDGESVTRDTLIAAGLIRRNAGLVKLLGDGEIARKVDVTVDHCSASARSKVEAAGGSVTVPEKPAVTEETTEGASA